MAMAVPALLGALLAVPPASAQSLFPGQADSRRAALLPAPAGDSSQPRTGSLFTGTAGHSLFAPLPARAAHAAAPRASHPAFLPGTGAVDRLRHLIAEAEAGPEGYDAVNHGARIKPPRAPSSMTIGEIYDWIAATPGQPHAIGRYQFIPATLRRLIRAQGVDRGAVFSPALQDRLADQLLAEAGLGTFQRGEMTRRTFMYRLARIWAGLPLPSGKSYYQGVAGNQATMSWARFEAGMMQIFPG
ncbi:hypothetical protein GQA70_16980 [Ponticoccus alexandrii]|uniref:Glycoside hydrolase family 104 protein n=2 Tax=Ponticoccus alexandrii TaxID=1943633 RepID=A0ABX7FER5_9RHOB|nr:hypothetical protein GQA70_16980 [Ponticoccus alexandrii]